MKNFLKRVLALALVLVMVSGYVPANVFAAEAAPALPTATVSKIRKADLTFALNFAADQITDEQLAYYGDWYADFELTVNKDVTFDANGGADGYLAGQYDGEWEDVWAGQWFYVPFNGPVNLEANESLRIMAFAAEALNEPGLKYTYKEVYEIVKDFNCGVFLEDAFLAANPDLEVKLELRMYNPKNETEAYTIGQTHIFTLADVDSAPALPTATATDLQKDELTFAMTFQADEITSEQLAFYGDWYADFELTVNKDVTLNANGGADGYLAGQYDGSWEDVWNGQWVNVPFDASVTLKANEPLKIMAFAAEKLGEPGLKYTYKEVYEVVKEFNCGAYFTPEFLVANPDLEVKLELKMYNEVDESESYVIGNTYIFKNEFVAYNVQTGKLYAKVSEATIAAVAGQTVRLLKNAEDMIVYVLDDITLDLDGYTLTTDYLFVTGDMVDDSEENTGLLKVSNHVMMQKDNRQLPVKTADGYKFFEILGFNAANTTPPNPDAVKYVFQPLFEAAAHEDLKAGQATTGVRVIVRVTWTRDDGIGAQDFVYNDDKVNTVLNSYNPATGKYGQMYTLELDNVSSYQGLTYQVYVVSDRSPEFTVGSQKVSVENQMTTEAVNLDNKAGATAVVPEGTKVDAGAKTLSLKVTNMAKSNSNIALQEGESQKSVDVHVDGIAADNTVPTLVTVEKLAAAGLNEGNLKLYHVENGATNLMTQVMTLAEVDEHNEFWYDVATGNVTMALATFSEIAAVENELNPWDGSSADSLTANAEGVYEIFNANQLAKFGAMVDEGNTFDDKTVRLMMDVNLKGSNGGVYFNPIGYGYGYSGGKVFSGTFDGNGNTIRGLTQSGWDMEAKGMGDYTYSTAGGGLFASVKDATIKNLTMDGAYVVMECIDMGTVVGYAQGNCTFENIVVKNSVLANYQRYTGGAIGEVSNGHHSLKNVDVEASTTVSSLWGDFDASLGGIIGGKWGHNNDDRVGENGHKVSVDMKNCDVAARLDAYNDVTSAYQWYSYRRCGMLIGHSEETTTLESGRTEATASYLTTDNCTVSYGDWINYHYCEFPTTTSLNARYPWVRVEENLRGFNGAYSNPRYGVPMFGEEKLDVENHTVDDGRHTNENQHHVLIALNQLYGGGQGCYGGNSHVNNGVTVLRGETLVTPATKFKSKVEKNYLLEIENGQSKTVTLGELFEESGNADVVDSGVYAFVSLVNKDDTVRGTYRTVDYSKDWTKNTLTFTGKGVAKITITDYYFCTPTTITINVGEVAQTPVKKFAHVFPNTANYLYRIGNANAVKLSSLFEAVQNVEIGEVKVTVETVDGTATGAYTPNAVWTNGEIQFGGTGAVKVTITDNDYCVPTVLHLEVVDAYNTTTAIDVPYQQKDVVLLNNVGASSITVSAGYTLHGNQFTVTFSGDGSYRSAALSYGFVTLESGNLDSVQIKCKIFPYSYLYTSQMTAGSDGRYPYGYSAVITKGNSTISNCYIYGARNNILVGSGSATIKNTITECASVANIQVKSSAGDKVTLENVTTIQHLKDDDFGVGTKVIGFAILMGDTSSTSYPTLELVGDLNQYNWVTEADKEASDSYVKQAITGALKAETFVHTNVDGVKTANLGIAFLNPGPVDCIDDTACNMREQYEAGTVEISGANGYVYSISDFAGTPPASNAVTITMPDNREVYPTVSMLEANSAVEIALQYDETLGAWNNVLSVDLDAVSGGSYEFSFNSIELKKHGHELSFDVKDSAGYPVDKNTGISLNVAKTLTYELVVTDNWIYSSDATISGVSETVTIPFTIVASKKTIDKPVFSGVGNGTALKLTETEWFTDYWRPAYAALEGVFVKYYDGVDYVELDLSKLPAAAGTINGAVWTYTISDGVVLTIEGGTVHSDGTTIKPLVVNDMLYFVSSDKHFSEDTASRDINLTYTFTDANQQSVTKSMTKNVAHANLDSQAYSTFTGNKSTLKYTVTYDANGGRCELTKDCTTNTKTAVTLPMPTRDDYMFEGWYTAASGGTKIGDAGASYKPTANITLYAQWGKPSTVTYDANGGTCDKTSENYTGTALTLPTPTKDGYWFKGWYDGSKTYAGGSSYRAGGDITLVAQWSPIYTVTYNANGGSVDPASAKYEGTALTLPTPTKDGEAFDGWYTEVSGGTKIGNAGASYIPTANITLYAQWKNVYTVSFDMNDDDTYNDADEACAPQNNKSQPTITLPNPTRTGWTFQGWSDGITTYAGGAEYTPSADITLTAQWYHIPYTISVSTSSATVSGVTNGQIAYYGDTISVTVSFSKNNSKTLTVKDANGNTLLNESTAGTYTFTMPDSTVTISASSASLCVTSDTMVTLADGTQKRIDQLTYDDEILVWDFVNGCYATAPSSTIVNHGYGENTVIALTFEDGTVVKTVNAHGFYHVEGKEFVALNQENAESYIGQSFVKQDGEHYATVKLEKVSVTQEYIEAWSVVSSEYYNCYLDGVLTISPYDTEGAYKYFTPFEIDENMKYDVEAMQRDIEIYGLFTYDDVAEYITYKQFVDFNVAMYKVAVGKGYMSEQTLIALLNDLSLYGGSQPGTVG